MARHVRNVVRAHKARAKTRRRESHLRRSVEPGHALESDRRRAEAGSETERQARRREYDQRQSLDERARRRVLANTANSRRQAAR